MDRSAQMLAAARNGNVDKVRDMLRRDARLANARSPDGVPAVHLAAGGGHAELVALLIENGADVNARDANGWTPLHLAAAHGSGPLVQVLLAHGADATARTTHATPDGHPESLTALDIAERGGHGDAAAVLRQGR
jgi:ankyrin repeat protein